MKNPKLSPRMAPPTAVTITPASDKRPNCASAAPASRMVSPGTGRPVFSSMTPTNTTAYPYRAKRSTSHSGTPTLPDNYHPSPSTPLVFVLHNHHYVVHQTHGACRVGHRV